MEGLRVVCDVLVGYSEGRKYVGRPRRRWRGDNK